MDVWRTVLVLLRRWYITVPAFVGTLALAGAAYSARSPSVPVRRRLRADDPAVRRDGGDAIRPPGPAHQPADELRPQPGTLGVDRHPAAEQRGDSAHPGRHTRKRDQLHGHQRQHQPGAAPVRAVHLRRGDRPERPGGAGRRRTGRLRGNRASSRCVRPSSARRRPPTSPSRRSCQPTPGRPLLGSPMRAAAAAGGLAGLVSLAAVFGFENLMFHRRLRRLRRDAAVEQNGRRVDPERSRRP